MSRLIKAGAFGSDNQLEGGGARGDAAWLLPPFPLEHLTDLFCFKHSLRVSC